jgi:hypothetical protein
MNLLPAFRRAAVTAACGFISVGLASEPASHDVAIPTTPGQTVVVEWTGEALPGVTGQGTWGAFADPSLDVGCVPNGPDDAHAINLAVPEGAYDNISVTADFHIEWEAGASYDAVALTASDPDLKLSVWKTLPFEEGWSDGGAPEENVGLQDPAAGTYNAIVCPFTASKPTPYRARLTLTAVSGKACLSDRGRTTSIGGLTVGRSIARRETNGLENFDAFRIETGRVAKAVPTDAHGRWQQVIYDRSLGLPTFLWARKDAPVAAVGALNTRDLLVERARAHLRSEAKELHLTASLIDNAKVFDAQFNGDGPAVVRFRQQVDGVEVFHRSLNVLLSREYKPVAVSGYFAPGQKLPKAVALGAAQAIATAWTSLGGALEASALTSTATRGDWQMFDRPGVTGTHFFERGPRAKRVWYPRAAGLEPAWLVEIFASAKVNGQLLAYALVVSAADGAILHRDNLKADAFTYRTFADPNGPLHQPFDSPLGNAYAPFPGAAMSDRPARIKGGSQLVTLDHAGIVTGDPWLADDATKTSGNHVDACIDTYDQGVETPAGGLAVPPPVNSCVHQPVDLEPAAATTGDHTFDYPIAADDDPAGADAKNAAAVNLFYMNNWLHDWWYNHGFNELSGVAQKTNYGRGAPPAEDPLLDPILGASTTDVTEGDPILAQGQDGSGRNNANMATPGDGSSPVMQQYLFDGPPIGEVRIVAPFEGKPLVWVPIKNAGDPDYDITESVGLTNDGLGDSMTDGCGPTVPYPEEVEAESPTQLPAGVLAPPDPSLAGKIALIDRGTCFFTGKIQYAEASGAVGLIIVNNVDGDPPSNVGNGDIPLSPVQPTEHAYTIPTVMVRKDDGQMIKDLIAGGADVQVRLQRLPAVDVDGTLDNQIIAHEYFHYVHHRLTDSSNQQADAMSEGWGDIDAFMMTLRGDDRGVPGNAGLAGAYGLAGYVTNNFWAGIRRVPYSTSFDYNAFTLRHIADGQPTPDGGDGATNSEVHSAGEIWANEMFECYVGIQNDPRHSFDSARARMQDYIIGGFKMTPADATYTEGRDAVLSVMLATDFDDYKRCSHGFARRGSGLNAVAPARSSTDLTGVVEDYTEFVCTGKAGEETFAEGRGFLLGGAFGPGLLLPLLGFAALRRRREGR